MTHSSSKFENMAMNSGQFYTLSSLAWFACQTLIQSWKSLISPWFRKSKCLIFLIDLCALYILMKIVGTSLFLGST